MSEYPNIDRRSEDPDGHPSTNRERIDMLYLQFEKFVSKSLMAFAVIGIFSTIGVAGTVIATGKLHKQAAESRRTAETAKRLSTATTRIADQAKRLSTQTTFIADQNGKLVQTIQAQRRMTILASCVAQRKQNIAIRKVLINSHAGRFIKGFPITHSCEQRVKVQAP